MHLKIVGSGGRCSVVMVERSPLTEPQPAKDSEEEEEKGQNVPPQMEDSWEAGSKGGSPTHQASFFPSLVMSESQLKRASKKCSSM